MLKTPPAYERPWTRRRLQVPHEDGALFADPPLDEAPALIRQNHAELDEHAPNVQGKTLPQLRQWTQQAVLPAAREYTSTLIGAELPDTPVDFLVAAGHQPELFHPGVWVKNFALHELARRGGGTGLNLIVDNDILPSTRIRVPAGDRPHPTREMIPFDADRPAAPWEEAHVLDRELFQSFGDRITEAMSAWNVDPLIRDIWPDAIQFPLTPHPSPSGRAAGGEGLLRDGLTAARHRLERRWGAANLELPLSRLCDLDPFLWFASHLLAQLPRFREIHNQVLHEFRQVNRIRSRTHPVADLAETDGWLEAPFWVWREGDQRRGRVFAKQVGRRVHLSDGSDVFAELPLDPEMDACCAVEVLRELPARGIRFRTRALTTTLFARLCLCDLFIHGIGGAKYDEMTDRIIARFFGLPAPEYLTLSATLRIPLAEPFNVTPQDETRLKGLLRDLDHNSDRHLTRGAEPNGWHALTEGKGVADDPPRPSQTQGVPSIDALIDEKARLIVEQKAVERLDGPKRERRARRQQNYRRFCRFHEINEQLAGHTLDQRRRIEEELQTVRSRLQANTILRNREFSFCLYPAETLRPFMTGLGDR